MCGGGGGIRQDVVGGYSTRAVWNIPLRMDMIRVF